jgi:hypothetical protein
MASSGAAAIVLPGVTLYLLASPPAQLYSAGQDSYTPFLTGLRCRTIPRRRYRLDPTVLQSLPEVRAEVYETLAEEPVPVAVPPAEGSPAAQHDPVGGRTEVGREIQVALLCRDVPWEGRRKPGGQRGTQDSFPPHPIPRPAPDLFRMTALDPCDGVQTYRNSFTCVVLLSVPPCQGSVSGPAPVVVALVDTAAGEEFLELVRSSLEAALEALPPVTRFALITMSNRVRRTGAGMA